MRFQTPPKYRLLSGDGVKDSLDRSRRDVTRVFSFKAKAAAL